MTQIVSADKSVSAAISAVDRGWFVFPLIPNTKRPAIPWREGSSKQHNHVYRWAKQYPRCNWGVDCAKSGLVVLDVDNKNGKDGTAALLALPPFRTLSVITPNKGKHFYFSGSNPSRHAVKPGIDLKADGGYVVLFGSTLPTGEYFIAEDVPTAPAPKWLAEMAGKRLPRDPHPEAWATEPDKAEYIRWAIDWLRGPAPESVQGQNGDDTLVKRVFFTLRDNGISQNKAVELIKEHYNEAKSFPPWSDTELETKARNAYRYAALPPAAQTLEMRGVAATAAFAGSPLPGIQTFDVRDIVAANLPPDRWIIKGRLIRGYATGLVAPGGVGKSIYSLLDALAVATGRDLTGDRVMESGPVVVFNAEDPLLMLKKRFAAAAQFYSVPLKTMAYPVYLVSGRDHRISVATFNQRTNAYTTNTADIASLTDLVCSTGAILFIGDPFIEFHDVPENDNNAIKKAVGAFTDLADRAQISVQLIHHTRKLNSTGGEGDMDTSRGASSFMYSLRLAHTLTVMGTEDAKKYGISNEERRWYIRLDDAKLNLAPPADKVRWYKRVSVTLENGENIGTLELTPLEAATKTHGRSGQKDIQAAVVFCKVGEDTPLGDVVSHLIDINPLEKRSAVAIAAMFRRRFQDGRAYQMGNVEVSLVNDALGVKRQCLRITPLDLSLSVEREMLG